MPTLGCSCDAVMQHCRVRSIPHHVQLDAAHVQRCPVRMTRSSCRARKCSAMKAANRTSDADPDYKNRVRDMWRQRGATYDVNNSFHPPLCQRLVDLAGVQPGASVLDVCCGTGTVAFAVAAAAGPIGRVVGVDISEAMLEQVCACATSETR